MADPEIQDAGSSEGALAGSFLTRLAIRNRGRLLASVVLLALAILHALAGGKEGGRFQNAIFDAYQRLAPRTVESFPVTIVDIDEATLEQFGQWPWPRTLLAQLIQGTAALGPLAVGIDIILVEPDRMSPDSFLKHYPLLSTDIEKALSGLPTNDAIFAQTIRDLPVVVGRAAFPFVPPGAKPRAVTSTSIQVEGSDPRAKLTQFAHQLVNVPEISEAAFGHGYLNGPPDPDGTVRRMPIVMSVNGKIVPSMALEMIRVALGANWLTVVGDADGFVAVRAGEAVLDADPKGIVNLHFAPSHPQRRISATRVLSGELAPDTFANQLVLVGVTGLGLTDAPATPISPRMDGVEVQAQLIENILLGSRLIRPSYMSLAELGVFLMAGVLLIAVMPRFGPIPGVVLAALIAVVSIAAGIGGFTEFRLLLDPSYPVLASVMVFCSLFLSRHLETEWNKKVLDANLRRQRIENARMAGELTAAREIQMGILPGHEAFEAMPESIDAFAFLEPAKEVGGDLYDIFMIDNRRMFFIVGDVSGKGVPAALFMALSKALCKNAAFRNTGSINDLINGSNVEIMRENPAFLFVTAFAGIIDIESGEMEYCNAGHDAPYLRRADGTLLTLESVGGPPICVVDDFEYPMERFQLAPGDSLLVFTDGVTEAMDMDEEMYGFDRISAYFTSIEKDASATSTVEGLYKNIGEFVGDAPPWDDITIMNLRYRATG